MALKKTTSSADEIVVFDDAVINKHGDCWQFRMWLANERKCARFSLKTRNQSTALVVTAQIIDGNFERF